MGFVQGDLTVNYSNPNQPSTSENYSWRNSWFASVGGEYYLDDKFTLRAGVAVDSTPTYDDTRSPRVPDSTRKWVAFGLGYKATERFEINAGYAHIFVNNAHIAGVVELDGRSPGRRERRQGQPPERVGPVPVLIAPAIG